MSRPVQSRSRGAGAASWALLAILLGFIVFCGFWRVQGGRWERVETPSMGTVAPVNSLLWVKPTHFDTLRPGDFISFHPPGDPGATYSHRVLSRESDGTITTKGVIPGPDPWRLTSGDVIGEVHMVWWGAGWLVVAAPVLLVGGLVVAAIRAWVRPQWKLPVVILLGSVVLTVAIVGYRPFTDAQQLAFAPDAGGGATATYVGTGLLPIGLYAEDGTQVVMRDGEVGSVHVESADAQHQLRVGLKPAVPTWWWVLLVGACFLPALYSLLIGFPTRPETGSAAPTA